MITKKTLSHRLGRVHHGLNAVKGSSVLRNAGWLTLAEFVSRFGRIFAAIALARTLDATAFGVAALALTIFEIIRLFADYGIGAAVVRASDEELAATTNTAYRLVWMLCGAIVFIQVLIGAAFAYIYNQPTVGMMIASLSSVFLIMPFGVVHGYILQRDERFKRLSIVSSSQNVSDHILTAILALTGFGAWAIVLPKVLTTPIWLIGVAWGKPWKRNVSAGYSPMGRMTRFALPVMASSFVAACRDNADKLIISVLLGIEALGIFYFAFNAGLGLSSSINRAVNAALYPYLCKALAAGECIKARFERFFFTAGPLLVLIYLSQAAAALFYVPFIFGKEWAFAAPLVAIFCLAGPARLAVDAAGIYVRAQGNPDRELILSALFLTGAFAGLIAGTQHGLTGAAIGLTLASTLTSAGIIANTLFQMRTYVPVPNQKGA